MSSTYISYVSYSAEDPSAPFDVDYFVKTHFPLAERLHGPHGLLSWNVTVFDLSAAGPSAPYRVLAMTEWTSKEACEKAFALEVTKEIIDDVKNFTTLRPTAWGGQKVASG